MKPHLIILSVTALSVGCGQPQTEITSIPDPQVRVIGLDGVKKTIPSADLYVQGSGEPTVDSVMVIDRRTNKKDYVKIDQLAAESPAAARYILATESP